MNKKVLAASVPIALLGSACLGTAGVTVDQRTSLPVPDPKMTTYTEFDVRNVPRPDVYMGVEAPAGAPNVLVILLDDVGYGQGSGFGGPVDMPTFEALAKDGLVYTQFHTTALSSPTRTALLTGRNHHMNNMGTISESATSFPGNTGARPNNIAAIPKVLKYNGYTTGMFGKDHEIPPWESGPGGNQRLWPTSIGFDKFYGFFGGETDQYQPVLVDGVTRIDTPRGENYHFTTDMTDQAINWIAQQKAFSPDRPFFTYFATGAAHAPHQAPKEWIAKYKGKFDEGWDVMRKRTFENQKAMGLIPKDTVMPPMPDYITPWDKLSENQKKIMARQMEVYAGFLAHTDHEVGRLIQSLKDMGEYDNTLIFYIVGDNGASPEGNMTGSFNSLSFYNGAPESEEYVAAHLDEWGSIESFPHYSSAWAVAGCAPFAWAKGTASDFGGTTNAMAVTWPKGIKDAGGIRTQWCHAIDIVPTILEATGLPAPKVVDGITQEPIQGTSIAYSFDDANAKDRHTTQYFELAGNRAIYDHGWMARVIHFPMWEDTAKFATLQNDKWELYNVEKDFALANDLADVNPKKLKEMKALFEKEAIANHVYPIDDRTLERLNAELAGRPDAMAGRTSLTLGPGMVGIPENSFINIKNKSYSITATLMIDDPKNASGVVIAQGGDFGGWSLFVKEGIPMHEYNWMNYERTVLTGDTMLKKGENVIKYVFKYNENGEGGDGNSAGIGKGGNAYMYLNGNLVGKVHIPNTTAVMFSFDDGVDVGKDGGGRASSQYEAPFKFTEDIEKVAVNIDID